MEQPSLTVLVGGARSGKSALAVRLASAHDGPVTYVATSPRIAGDDDLDARIATHRAERPAHWATVEDELDLAGAIAARPDDLVVVDCLTTWVGNQLHHGNDEAAVHAATGASLTVVAERHPPTIVVSNEVGLGVVPTNALGRAYRDLLGRVNQRWVGAADCALLLVAGRALPLLPVDEVLARATGRATG